MSNPAGKLISCVCLIFVMTMMAIPSEADQGFCPYGAVIAYANNDWSFLTAWDLTTGDLQRSESFYYADCSYDPFVWVFNEPYYNHWVAIFVYDEGTGKTRQLKWSYKQIHIQ